MQVFQADEKLIESVKFWSRTGLINLDEKTTKSLNEGTLQIDPLGEIASQAKVFDTQTKEMSGKTINESNLNKLKSFVLNDSNLNENTAPSQQVGDPNANGLPAPIEANPTTLLTMTRKVLQQNIANAFMGVQPMTSSSQTIFAVRARYLDSGNPVVSNADTEALHNTMKTGWSGNLVADAGVQAGFPLGWADDTGGSEFPDANPAFGEGMLTSVGQDLGSDTGNAYSEMGFTVQSVPVTANTRALKATISDEVETDLRNAHGMSASQLLTDIMSTEIQAETNRELIRKMNLSAKYGAEGTATQGGVPTQQAGITNMDGAEIDGRWSAEKYKTLYFRIEREANSIAKDTRRGKGNVLLCSPNVASALIIGGMIDYAPALNQMNDPTKVDITMSTFVGRLSTGLDVHVDPYTEVDYYTVAFKGSNMEAGIYFCPYTMLEFKETIGSSTLQMVKGVKTRYGVVANPFYAKNADNNVPTGAGLGQNENGYFRKSLVLNLK